MEYTLIQSPNSLSTDSAIETILINRDIAREEIHKYLNPSDDYILPARQLDNIREGAKLLAKHITLKSKTLLIVDSDFDGYSSSALLLNYLYNLVPTYIKNCVTYITHETKAHGIIEEAITDDIEFLIVPDAALDTAAVARVRARGIEILNLDHHVNSQAAEQDAVIINPMLCSYENKFLCGCGVVYKFCKFLDSLFHVSLADNYLDLVAAAELGDIMDIRPIENLVMVKKGLQQIHNPFLTTMITRNRFSIGEDVTPFGISFYVVPFVNAVTRVGTIEEKRLLFESFLEFKAYEEVPSTKRGCRGQVETLVEQAVRVANNVKARQKKAIDTGTELIKQLIEKQNLLKHKLIVVCLKAGMMERGLTGLVAGQIANKYGHPTLILHETYNENGDLTWSGSGRGISNMGFDDFRGFLEESNYVDYAHGHNSAFGVSILDKKVEALVKYADVKLANINFSAAYRVDFKFKVNDINITDKILEIAKYKDIYSKGIEEPLVVMENIPITRDNITLMSPDRHPTIKISLPNGTSLIKFRATEEEFYQLQPDSDYTTKFITIVGKCAVNEWQGKITPQILIEDYEVLERIGFDF